MALERRGDVSPKSNLPVEGRRAQRHPPEPAPVPGDAHTRSMVERMNKVVFGESEFCHFRSLDYEIFRGMCYMAGFGHHLYREGKNLERGLG